MKLGKVNVDKMLRKLTAKQFAEWEAFAYLEPFDETRMDYRTAHIVQMLYNINRGKNQQPLKLEECVLKFEPTEVEEKPKKARREEHIRIFKILERAYATPGKDLK